WAVWYGDSHVKPSRYRTSSNHRNRLLRHIPCSLMQWLEWPLEKHLVVASGIASSAFPTNSITNTLFIYESSIFRRKRMTTKVARKDSVQNKCRSSAGKCTEISVGKEVAFG